MSISHRESGSRTRPRAASSPLQGSVRHCCTAGAWPAAAPLVQQQHRGTPWGTSGHSPAVFACARTRQRHGQTARSRRHVALPGGVACGAQAGGRGGQGPVGAAWGRCSEPPLCSSGLEEVVCEEPALDALSGASSEVLDVISSEELEATSDEEPSDPGGSWGRGELSEELEFVSSEDAASLGDTEDLSEECEEQLGEDSGPEPEPLLGPWV